MIEVYEKGIEVQLGKYFTTLEFQCHCKTPECDMTLIDSDLVDRLNKMREEIGHPLVITSGYRCPKYQEMLRASGLKTAVGISTHSEGMAADLKVRHMSGEDLEKIARDSGFESVGVARTWIHADIRKGHRRWTY